MDDTTKQKITFLDEIGKNTWLYVLLASVFMISFVMSLIIDLEIISQAIIALPGGAAAVGLVVQIIRDNEKYKRDLELQKNEHEFSLAFSSHIAKHAFEKYVGFSDEYIGELLQLAHVNLNKGIPLKGMIEKANEVANNLYILRIKYFTWLPESIQKPLDEIEKDINLLSKYKDVPEKSRKLGAGEMPDFSAEDQKRFQECFALANQLMLVNNNGLGGTDFKNNNDQEVNVLGTIHKIKAILQIERIYELQKDFFKSQVNN